MKSADDAVIGNESAADKAAISDGTSKDPIRTATPTATDPCSLPTETRRRVSRGAGEGHEILVPEIVIGPPCARAAAAKSSGEMFSH